LEICDYARGDLARNATNSNSRLRGTPSHMTYALSSRACKDILTSSMLSRLLLPALSLPLGWRKPAGPSCDARICRAGGAGQRVPALAVPGADHSASLETGICTKPCLFTTSSLPYNELWSSPSVKRAFFIITEVAPILPMLSSTSGALLPMWSGVYTVANAWGALSSTTGLIWPPVRCISG